MNPTLIVPFGISPFEIGNCLNKGGMANAIIPFKEEESLKTFRKLSGQRVPMETMVLLDNFPDSIFHTERLVEQFARFRDCDLVFLNAGKARPVAHQYAQTLIERNVPGGKCVSLPSGGAEAVTAGFLSKITEFPEQIVVCGMGSTGKSTVSKGFESSFGYRPISSGRTVGEPMAKQRGMLLEELIELSEKDPSIPFDKNIDEFNQQLSDTETKFILDCRTGPLFVKKAFKILLTSDIEVAARRTLERQKKEKAAGVVSNRKKYRSLKDAIVGLTVRNEKDDVRYKRLYDGFDVNDFSLYDLHVNSAGVTIEEMVEKCKISYFKFLVDRVKNNQVQTMVAAA